MGSLSFATLKVATPAEVGRALASQGRYHFGVPKDYLEQAAYSPAPFTPVFYASDELKPGDRYVDTLNNWLEFVLGFNLPNELVSAFFDRFKSLRKANFALTVLGYIPLVIEVPERSDMSYSPHGKIVLSGDFVAANGTQLEGWSASMSYDVVGPDVGAMPNTIGTAALTSIANAWGAVISSNPGGSGVGFSSRTRLTDVAYWRAKSDGKSTTGQWERYHKASPSVGVGTPGQHALQVATVVSLDAFGPRGGRFGRFYLPAVHEPLEDFRYSTSLVTQLLSSVKQALTTTNTVLSGVVDGDVELVVASGRGNGENRPVRSVKIGRVPDTMRSRRRALEEGYVVTDFQAIP